MCEHSRRTKDLCQRSFYIGRGEVALRARNERSEQAHIQGITASKNTRRKLCEELVDLVHSHPPFEEGQRHHGP